MKTFLSPHRPIKYHKISKANSFNQTSSCIVNSSTANNVTQKTRLNTNQMSSSVIGSQDYTKHSCKTPHDLHRELYPYKRSSIDEDYQLLYKKNILLKKTNAKLSAQLKTLLDLNSSSSNEDYKNNNDEEDYFDSNNCNDEEKDLSYVVFVQKQNDKLINQRNNIMKEVKMLNRKFLQCHYLGKDLMNTERIHTIIKISLESLRKVLEIMKEDIEEYSDNEDDVKNYCNSQYEHGKCAKEDDKPAKKQRRASCDDIEDKAMIYRWNKKYTPDENIKCSEVNNGRKVLIKNKEHPLKQLIDKDRLDNNNKKKINKKKNSIDHTLSSQIKYITNENIGHCNRKNKNKNNNH